MTDWGEKIANSIEHVEFNKNDKLPFGYFHPNYEGKIYWICSYSKDQKIISTFFNDEFEKSDPQHRFISELSNEENAIKIRNDLIADNWQPLKTPQKHFICNGVKIDLNKKNKKIIEKQMKKELKKSSTYKDEVK